MIEAQRLCELNSAPEVAGRYVLYWMQQSQRANCNPALEAAVAAADRLGLPVLVCFGLMDPLPRAQARHYAFMLEGLAETARTLRQRGIGFVMRRGRPDEVALQLAPDAALVVCDHGYLRSQKAWRQSVAQRAGRRVLRVEGDVVVPVALASGKTEIGARSLRPKIEHLRERFLVRLRARRPQVSAQRLRIPSALDPEEWPRLLRELKVEQGIGAVSDLRGGYSHARHRLRHFVGASLGQYCAARALPGAPQVSGLSPYLHFGQISPVEIAMAVRDADAPEPDRSTFLEELIVRRELAVNFVEYNPHYDRYESLPQWAQRSLGKHAGDRREYVYGREMLEAACTHDPYWNAAMRQMRRCGYMHNHMRMYWGKKVLEWSPSPQEAYRVLLRLNNSYFIDGRDPSSFANVGWVFGLHDRPWPERPVFGNVRYMNAAGLRRKTDIESYVRIWGGDRP